MTTIIDWIVEFHINEGAYDEFLLVMNEMIESAKKEEGTLAYEWSVDATKRICHIHERYRDAAATLTHLATVGEKFAPSLAKLGKNVGTVVYGQPDTKVKAALTALNPTYFTLLAGFTK